MSGFEFGLIPVAIIVGFALSQILIAWGHIVRQWSALQRPGLFLSFTGMALVGVLSHFVGDWSFRTVDLHFGTLMLIILPTLALVLAMSVILPANDDFPADLEAHYFKHVRKSAMLFASGITLGVLPDYLPGAQSVPEMWMVLTALVPIIAMAATQQRLVHIASQAVLWGLMLMQMSSLTDFGFIN